MFKPVKDKSALGLLLGRGARYMRGGCGTSVEREKERIELGI